MNLIDNIRLMNNIMIIYLKKMNLNYEKNKKISKILDDEACFFKMNKKDSIYILKEIGIKNNIEEVYNKLISKEFYQELYEKGKIKENDKLFISYNFYGADNLFKDDKYSLPIKKESKTIWNKIINKIKNRFKI